MLKKWVNVLSSCSLFEGINLEELQNMLDCFNPKLVNYERNELISVAGEEFNGLGIVLEGNVAITKENVAGDRVIIDILSPGQIFGEIAAFSGNKLWPATVVAHTDCTVIFMAPEIILGTCKKQCVSHKQLIKNMLKIISKKALLLNKKLQYLSMKSIRSKISSYLLEQYKEKKQETFMLPLKRNEMADFLNIARPSLSREMCRMRDEGIIDFHRESVKIKDPDALKSMAE